jgi:hypothetical protein
MNYEKMVSDLSVLQYRLNRLMLEIQKSEPNEQEILTQIAGFDSLYMGFVDLTLSGASLETERKALAAQIQADVESNVLKWR